MVAHLMRNSQERDLRLTSGAFDLDDAPLYAAYGMHSGPSHVATLSHLVEDYVFVTMAWRSLIVFVS